ncbi:hypothetical protein FHG87_001393 [Trinorchestia longiramus]|nr:hypothetical protein FHG87_001393 [Trinorchestia longiramus]
MKRLVKKNRNGLLQLLTSKSCKGFKSNSPRVMRRKLKKLLVRSCISVRKPLVPATNQKKLLQFSKEHRNLTVDDWKRVIWPDESRFTSFRMMCILVRLGPQDKIDDALSSLCWHPQQA